MMSNGLEQTPWRIDEAQYENVLTGDYDIYYYCILDSNGILIADNIPSKKIAIDITRAVNSHAALVDALEKIIGIPDLYDDDNNTIKIIRMVNVAKAALAAAKEGAINANS